MSRQNNFLDELAALLEKYKVDVSVEFDNYPEGINFYSPALYDEESRAMTEVQIDITLPASIFHDNLSSTIQSFKE